MNNPNNPNQSGAFAQGLSEGELLEYEERARLFLQHQLQHQPTAAAEFGLAAMPPPAARVAGPPGVAGGNSGAAGYGGLRAPAAPGLSFLPPQAQFAAFMGVPSGQGMAYAGALGGGAAAAATSDQYGNVFGFGGMVPAGLDPQQQAQFAAFLAASRGMALPQGMVLQSPWLVQQQQQQQQQFLDPASGLSFLPGVVSGLPASVLEAAYARDSQLHLAAAQGGFARSAVGSAAGLPTETRLGATAEGGEDDEGGNDDEEGRARAAVRKDSNRHQKKKKRPSKKQAAGAPSPGPPDEDRPASDVGLTGRQPVPLWNDYDDNALTVYQCVLRKQIELFEATEEDLRGSAQGRNTPIRLGQVGIRCRHCSGMPKLARARGAVYYSRTVDGVYQVAQNMSKIHFVQTCLKIPKDLRDQLAKLQRVNNRASGGKEYWLESLRALGVYEDGNCVRFRPTLPGAGKKDGDEE